MIYQLKDNRMRFDWTYKYQLFGVFQWMDREKEFEVTGIG